MQENDKTLDDLLDVMAQQLFHQDDSGAKEIIDEFLAQYPELLTIHERDWYYEKM